jgi:hypothetical protein
MRPWRADLRLISHHRRVLSRPLSDRCRDNRIALSQPSSTYLTHAFDPRLPPPAPTGMATIGTKRQSTAIQRGWSKVRSYVARRCHRSVGFVVLHQCIRPLIGSCCAPGHHGYQRACVLSARKQRLKQSQTLAASSPKAGRDALPWTRSSDQSKHFADDRTDAQERRPRRRALAPRRAG